MGYLIDRDLNVEMGVSSEKPGRDYLGGREKRDYEIRFNEKVAADRARDQALAEQKQRDYLQQEANRQEIEKMYREAQEKLQLIERSFALERARATARSDASIAAGKAATQVGRAFIGAALIKYGFDRVGALIIGGPIGLIGGITFLSPSEISCGEGEKCVKK
ncbi:hypothetical protein ACW9HW_06185 [Pseudomonas sp. SDO5532_S415]